jgi:hypothetical protein
MGWECASLRHWIVFPLIHRFEAEENKKNDQENPNDAIEMELPNLGSENLP